MVVPVSDLDVLIVGAGFAGCYLLYRLRLGGFKVLALDASSAPGGVWNHNTYLGSRVDIEVPSYSLSLPEIWKGWKWSERFPGREELQRYFKHVNEKLQISGDVDFGIWVEGARWNEESRTWTIRASTGIEYRARWFVPAVGYAAKPFVPDLKGLSSFRGDWSHTALWPKNGIDLDGKKVAVIGTGASGVQVVQTIAPLVKELVVYQRTPAVAVPMQQRQVDERVRMSDSAMRDMYDERVNKFDGATGGPIPRSAMDDSPEQRKVEYDNMWRKGGFSFWTSNYQDLFANKTSADLAYEYWKRQVRSRITDAYLQQQLAPDEPPFIFGTKRVPLEQSYYDVYNLPHVSLVDLNKHPILEITPSGIRTTSDTTHDFDVIILATGFDVATGSLTQIDICGTILNRSLASAWTSGAKTYLGMSIHGFPNMLFPYGPQSPSNTCNGPLCAQIQGDWIVDFLQYTRSKGYSRIEAEEAVQEEWSKHVTGLLRGSLFEETRSFYFGDNIPGKKRELLFYFEGVPAYKGKIDKVVKEDFKGFAMS